MPRPSETSGRERSRAHAHGSGLPTLLDSGELRTRAHAATRYEDGLDLTIAACRRARALGERAARDRERVADLRARVEALGRAAQSEASGARRLVAEHAERDAALSAEASELRVRREAVDAELARTRTEVGRLQDADKQAGVAVAQAVTAVERATEGEVAARANREAALAVFARLERVDVFRLALDEDAPEDHRHAAAWTLTRALEVLRAIPAVRLVKEPAEKLAGGAHARVQRARSRPRAGGGYECVHDARRHGIPAVRVCDGAAERSLPELTARLGGEIAERDRTLTAEQRRVFGEALLEEIAATCAGASTRCARASRR